jgi:hypothetical protein
LCRYRLAKERNGQCVFFKIYHSDDRRKVFGYAPAVQGPQCCNRTCETCYSVPWKRVRLLIAANWLRGLRSTMISSNPESTEGNHRTGLLTSKFLQNILHFLFTVRQHLPAHSRSLSPGYGTIYKGDPLLLDIHCGFLIGSVT